MIYNLQVVWYIIGLVILLLVGLAVGLIVMNFAYKAKVKKERQKAIAEREALISGAEDVDIFWSTNDESQQHVQGKSKNKRAKIHAVAGGIELSEISVPKNDTLYDSKKYTVLNFEKQMSSIVQNMQKYIIEEQTENKRLSHLKLVDELELPDDILQSTDTVKLMAVIRRLQNHNKALLEGTEHKVRRSKRSNRSLAM